MRDFRFVWDPEKNRANLAKHGVAFEDARKIFDGSILERADDRFDYGEPRWNAIGLADGRELAVAYTVTHDDEIRIISARGATSKERRRYWSEISR